MSSVAKYNNWVVVFRWLVRIYGGLLAALVLALCIGEGGVPNPFAHPLPVVIEFFGISAMLIGIILGWKWHGLGGLLIAAGIVTFHIIEKRLWLGGMFPLFDLAAILYLLSWWLKKLKFAMPQREYQPGRNPQ